MVRAQSRWIPGKIRRSQIITTHGPGAIVDLPKTSVMLAGLHRWPAPGPDDTISEERLQAFLGVDAFRVPPVIDEDDPGPPSTLPAVKFPEAAICPGCHTIHDTFSQAERRRDRVSCPSGCRREVVPARFIAACEAGHCQDFPFREWSHDGQATCQEPMQLKSRGTGPGLSDLVVSCACGQSASMQGAFGEDALSAKNVRCAGQHPGLQSRAQDCQNNVRALQRGASNFYFPEVHSSICIPPWDGKVVEVIEQYRRSFGGSPPLRSDARAPALLSAMIEATAGWRDVRVDDVFELTDRAQASAADRDGLAFKWEEYRAFCEGASSSSEHPRFDIQRVDVPADVRPFLSQVVLGRSLEEVRALAGFRRITPTGDDANLNRLDRAAGVRWLPAVRASGEGIFMRLDARRLESWASNAEVERRTQRLLAPRAGARPPPRGSSAMILVHTLSHALMRRMALLCGYSSGSLRERVYWGDPAKPGRAHEAGILVYTGTTDSEGTLGGLVRLGQTDRLGSILRGAIQDMQWCSSDPICSGLHNVGQFGRNLAACHACLFAPETSCEMYNSILDRQALVGTPDSAHGYFSEWLA